MRLFALASAICCVLIAFCSPVAAQSRDKNWGPCKDLRSAPDVRIGACTAVIQSGQETPLSLAVAYNDRGYAYDDKGEYDRAIQDYGEAIRLNPDFAFAYNNRGIAYRSKGEYDRAIQYFNQVLRLKP